jgi:hypothetical protein
VPAGAALGHFDFSSHLDYLVAPRMPASWHRSWIDTELPHPLTSPQPFTYPARPIPNGRNLWGWVPCTRRRLQTVQAEALKFSASFCRSIWECQKYRTQNPSVAHVSLNPISSTNLRSPHLLRRPSLGDELKRFDMMLWYASTGKVFEDSTLSSRHLLCWGFRIPPSPPSYLPVSTPPDAVLRPRSAPHAERSVVYCAAR